MEARLDVVEAKLDMVLAALQRIEEMLEPINEDCSTMSNHIEFVESVYNHMRHPLNFISRRLGGGSSLPRLRE